MAKDSTTNGLKGLIQRLHDPLQLRVFITLLFLAVAYAGINIPLSKHIDEAAAQLKKDHQHRSLVSEVEYLLAQEEKLLARLPADTDTNEWVQYVMDGIRAHPLTVNHLDSDEELRLGPYSVVVLNVKLEGNYQDLDRFLEWLESNQRLFRVDAVKISPSRNQGDRRVMELTLLGLRG